MIAIYQCKVHAAAFCLPAAFVANRTFVAIIVLHSWFQLRPQTKTGRRSVLLFTAIFLGISPGLAMAATQLADLESAPAVYQERFEAAPEGVHRADGLVFVVIELVDAKSQNRSTLESRLLLRTVDLLRQHLTDASQLATDQPASNALLNRHSWLLTECRAVDPKFGTRAIEIKEIPTRVVENRIRGTTQRRAMAFAETDLKKEIENSPYTPPSVADTVAALRQRVECLDDEDSDRATAFLLRLGAVEDALAREHDKLMFEVPLLSYGEPRSVFERATAVDRDPSNRESKPDQTRITNTNTNTNTVRLDSLELVTYLDEMRKRIASPDVSKGEVIAMLRKWPGYPPALRWLSRHYSQANRPAFAINLAWLSCVDGESENVRNQELMQELERWGKSTANSVGLDQYATLMTNLRKAELPAVFSQQARAQSLTIVQRAWWTAGHLNTPHSPDPPRVVSRDRVSQSQANPSERDVESVEQEEASDRARAQRTNVLKIAERIQNTSTSIHQATEVFLHAIQEQPHAGELWMAMGSALLESGDNLSAIPFLSQSLKYASDSGAARLMLARACEHLGYDELRRGYAFAALLCPALTDAERETAISHLK